MKAFKVVDLRFGLGIPKSCRGQILRSIDWNYYGEHEIYPFWGGEECGCVGSDKFKSNHPATCTGLHKLAVGCGARVPT